MNWLFQIVLVSGVVLLARANTPVVMWHGMGTLLHLDL